MRSRTNLLIRNSRARERISGVFAAAVAIAALVVGRHYGKITHVSSSGRTIAWLAAPVLLISGTLAVRYVATEVGRYVTRRATVGSGGSARLIAEISGYLILLFGFLGVLGVSLQRLLIGAGLTGVVFGIAGQQSLGNLFASVILVFARPFVVGDVIKIRSGSIGPVEATVRSIGLVYVTVENSDGTLMIPNLLILTSGIEHAHPAPTSGDTSDDPGSAE